MKRPLILAILFSGACYGSQMSSCESGTGPTPVPVVVASPSPTPSPTPVAVGTPDPCSFKTLAVGFNDDSLFTLNGTRKLLYVAMLDSKGSVIPGSCQNGRFPAWRVSDTSFCEVIGGGFKPELLARSVTISKCEVTASLRDEFQGVTITSNVFVPEIR
jgi:hypothetical protein